MQSIPASADVNIVPGVLSAGGSGLTLNGVIGSQNSQLPYGTAQGFPNLTAVGNFFGLNSAEYTLAGVYFTGFTNCTQIPANLFFAQYNQSAIAGFLRSGSLPALATLVGYSGNLVLPVNGKTITSANINLASATSPSNAAALVQTGLQGGTTFSGTGSVTSNLLTITVVTSGVLAVGDTVTLNSVTGTISSFGTGTGGVGTYNVTMANETSGAVTVAAPAVTVSYNAQLNAFVVLSPTTGVGSSVGFATGTLALDLLMSAGSGAVLSAGAAAQTPAGFVALLQAATQNWAGWTTAFDPDAGATGGPVKVAMAQATSVAVGSGPARFFYVGEDIDGGPTVSGTDTGSFSGQTANLVGRVALWSQPPQTFSNPDGSTYVVGDTYGKAAAFILGCAAATNWGQINGRITYKFRSNPNLNPSVVNLIAANNLDANGYNYYAAIATANENFQYLRQGKISGTWTWIDPYVNQIYFNSQLQLSLLSFATSFNAIPYNDPGYALLRATMKTPITQAKTNGTIVTGVQLTAAQIQALIQATGGLDISGTLFEQGWYLQILDPGGQARQNRTTPNMTLWYTDGGAIQSLSLASIDVQ